MNEELLQITSKYEGKGGILRTPHSRQMTGKYVWRRIASMLVAQRSHQPTYPCQSIFTHHLKYDLRESKSISYNSQQFFGRFSYFRLQTEKECTI